jgi:hypothetical protein
MASVRIPPGVVRGESRAMVPGRWYDTNLIRWQNGIMKPVGGWERMTQTPLGSIPRAGHVWRDSTGVVRRYFLCDHATFLEVGGTFYDNTPVGYVNANTSAARGFGSGVFGALDFGMDDEDRGSGAGYDPRSRPKFSMDNWDDELLLLSSADGRIMKWNPATDGTGTKPTVATGVPTLVQAFVCTDEHHLMTFGSAGFPNRVAWSAQNDRTDWDYADVAGSAGFNDLEGAGMIVSGHKIPGGVLIFTTTSVWIARYIGAPYFYSFNKLAEGCSPISAHAVAIAGSRAIWMGLRSFWQYQGGTVSPLQSTLGIDPFEEIDKLAAPRRVTCGFNGAYPEVWFFYPTNQGLSPLLTENNRYIVHNFEEGWWAPGYRGCTFYNSSPIDGFPISGDYQTHLFFEESGYLAEGNPRGSMVYAEVGSISFDDGANNWQINQAQVDNPTGPQNVRFDFRGKRVRGGPTVDLALNKLARADGFLDLHFTARDFSMRVEGVTDGPWSLGAMHFKDPIKRGPV